MNKIRLMLHKLGFINGNTLQQVGLVCLNVVNITVKYVIKLKLKLIRS
jgi:hypothetical protein